MKHLIITAVIAVVTGVAGYFLGSGLLSSGQIKLGKEGFSLKGEKRFNSEAILQIDRFGGSNVFDEPGRIRSFLQTHFSIIKSNETLKKAIIDYKLASLFSETEDELLRALSECVKLEQVKGTDLIRMIVFSKSELKAQQISYAVIKSYEKRWIESREKIKEANRDAFAEKRRIQEKKVERFRGRLYSLSKKLGIPYHGRDQQYEKLLIDSSKTPEKLTLSAEQKTQFGRARDDYERELAILDAVKQAEFRETLGEGLERNPVILHQHGWGDEVEKLMERFE